MLARSAHTQAIPPAHPDSEAFVGHITLGDRQFGVALASRLPPGMLANEICRFDIDGITLSVRATAPADQPGHDIATRLTARELQVAVLVAQGLATKNIAHHLEISEWTVGTYLRRIFAKLDVDNRAEMVYKCRALIDAKVGFARRAAAQAEA